MKFARDLVPRIDRMPTRKRKTFPEIEDSWFWAAYKRCSPYSLLHVTGFYNLWQSARYIADNRLAGIIVECGCFLGGAAAFLALALREHGLGEREILLFDTFRGPPVGSTDVFTGRQAINTPSLLPDFEQAVRATLYDVVGTLAPFRFVRGLVEETIPQTSIGDIALLRLDTDFYSSTKMEFEHLYPKLVPGGVLIVDDYGCFQGARRATDEYFATLARPALLNRIDAGVWAGVKPG